MQFSWKPADIFSEVHRFHPCKINERILLQFFKQTVLLLYFREANVFRGILFHVNWMITWLRKIKHVCGCHAAPKWGFAIHVTIMQSLPPKIVGLSPYKKKMKPDLIYWINYPRIRQWTRLPSLRVCRLPTMPVNRLLGLLSWCPFAQLSICASS